MRNIYKTATLAPPKKKKKQANDAAAEPPLSTGALFSSEKVLVLLNNLKADFVCVSHYPRIRDCAIKIYPVAEAALFKETRDPFYAPAEDAWFSRTGPKEEFRLLDSLKELDKGKGVPRGDPAARGENYTIRLLS